MNTVQMKMSRVLVLSIACVFVAVSLLWYCCGDQIALVYQVVYFGGRVQSGLILESDGEASDRGSVSRIVI